MSFSEATFAWRKRLLVITGLVILVVSSLILINYIFIGSYGKYVFTNLERLTTVVGSQKLVGIVLGGGIEDGQPKPLLKDRLDTAAYLLQKGAVRKLLLSGDNRISSYDEPGVMKNYLVSQKHIKASLIALDNAGRSTYETCERARKVFSLDKPVLISESTHLPRAVYLCRTFGIEAYGYSSDGQSSAGLKVGQRWREGLARTKAFINVYLIGEQTVLGNKINL